MLAMVLARSFATVGIDLTYWEYTPYAFTLQSSYITDVYIGWFPSLFKLFPMLFRVLPLATLVLFFVFS